MLQAYDMSFINGEYVFMDVELFPFPGEYWGSHDWRRGDSRDPDAKSAYEALLRVSLHQPIGPDWEVFVADVKQRAADEYDFIYGDEEVSVSVKLCISIVVS